MKATFLSISKEGVWTKFRDVLEMQEGGLPEVFDVSQILHQN